MGGKKKDKDASSAIFEDIQKGNKLLTDSNKRLTLLVLHYEEKIKVLQEEVAHVKEKASKKKSDELISKTQNLEQDKLRVEKNLFDKERILEHLQTKLERIRGDLAEQKTHREMLEKELVKRDAAFVKLEQVLSMRKQEVALARDVSTKMQERELDYQQDVKKVENVVRSQVDRLHKYEALVAALTKQNTELKQRESMLAKKMVLLREKISQAEQNSLRRQEENAANGSLLVQAQKAIQKHEQDKRILASEVLKERKESERLKADMALMQENAKSKDKAVIGLQEALKTRRKEVVSILKLNKELTLRDARYAEDYRSMKELVTIKNLKAKQMEETITLLHKDLEKHRELVELNKKAFEELSARSMAMQEEQRTTKQQLFETIKEAATLKKEILDTQAQTEQFKEKMTALFGVNRELTQENTHFEGYLVKLHELMQTKESSYRKNQQEMELQVAQIKENFEKKIQDTLAKDTEEIITLKSHIFELKSKLLEREMQLQEKERQEKLLLQSMAQGFGSLLKGDLGLEELKALQGTAPARPQMMIDHMMQPMMVFAGNMPSQARPALRHEQPKRTPIHRFVQPKDQQTHTETKDSATQTPQPITQEPPTLPKMTIVEEEEEESIAFTRPIAEATMIQGTVDQKEESMDDSLKLALESLTADKRNRMEISASYKEGDLITPMIDMALQQGDSIENIRSSLVGSGYPAKDVDEAIDHFKKGKIGFT